jgi:NADH-ubiquinone oxidoreductase chain 5
MTHKLVDRGTLELIGPTGLTNLFSSTSRNLASLDSGYIPNLALYTILSVITLTGAILYLDDARLILVFISALFLINSRHFITKTNSPPPPPGSAFLPRVRALDILI